MVTLHLLYSGKEYTITAFGESDDECEITEFLGNRQILSEADENELNDLFVRHGNHGPIINKTKSRKLDGNIFEYKARRGGRVAWFYEPGKLVVCACGVVKKKQKADPEFIRKANEIRDRYLEEKENGRIHNNF